MKPETASQEQEDETEVVARLVDMYEDSQEATETSRKLSERDRDYYDNKQLTSAELKKLKERGQPDIIINRIQPKVDYLLGFEASSRTEPRAFPRNPQDEDASEAATDAIRFMNDKLDLDQKFSTVWENMLIEGYGGLELTYDDQSGEIGAVEWNWDRLFYDPHSRKPDFSDARYLGGVIWMDEAEARSKWPDREDAINATAAEGETDHTYGDRPSWQRWTEGTRRKRVRICQMYYKEGIAWKWCIFTRGGKLQSGEVPFLDSNGMPFCPLLLQSSYVDRENNRYGLVRIMIGPQDEINKRRSKALHLTVMRQTLGEDGSVNDVDDMKKELAKPDGHVKVNPGFRFELLDHNDQLQGHLNLLQEAKSEIELIGPNSAMLGKQDGSPASGRAILANQQGGQTELTRLLDRHRHLKRRVYERIWDMIRQYKNEQWWIRVTDNEKNVKFVGLNRPVTLQEELLAKKVEEAVAQGVDQAEAEQQAQSVLQQMIEMQPELQAELQQVVRVENQPTEMDMDITLEEVTSVANVQEEQFKELANLASAGVVFPQEVYIRASSLRNKEELLEIMSGQQQQQGPSPKDEAEIEKTAAETEKIRAEAQRIMAEMPKIKADAMKTMAETEVVGLQQPQQEQPMLPDAPPIEQQGFPVQ